MAGGGRFKIKGGIASHGEAVVEDGALLITGITVPPAGGFPQEPWREGMSTRSMWFTDFLGGNSVFSNPPLVAITAGAGATVFGSAALSKADHPGVLSMTTGLSAVGRVFLISQALGSYNTGTNLIRIGTWMRTGAVLSTALERYTLRNGLFSIVLPNIVIEAAGFEYDDSQNGGRWQAITHDGVETSTDTGILVAADTWYKMEVEINAAATSVDFFIDNVLVATNVTNIPGAALDLFYNAHIMKLIGVGARIAHLDAAYGYSEITR